MNNMAAYYISSILFMPLVKEGPDLSFVYALAESIDTDDNRVFTISLNPNVRWTDGALVTADDVIFTMNILANPATGIPDPSAYRIIVGADESGLFPADANGLSGVRRIDSHTLVVETKRLVTLNSFKLNIATMLRAIPKHIF
jgi:peptide/nickel transport system substrate-binding protein